MKELEGLPHYKKTSIKGNKTNPQTLMQVYLKGTAIFYLKLQRSREC